MIAALVAAGLLVSASDTQLRLVTDEPEAVLSLMETLEKGNIPSEAQWERAFASEGYRRLEERETSMRRSFTREEFKAFLTSDRMRGRRRELAATLAAWSKADLGAAEARARAYLPAGTKLAATVYPVIKPRDNSFVFDLKNRPAIFLYLNPKTSGAKFENTVAHELHHVGYASACIRADDERLSPEIQAMQRWYGALGEGLAMLAAAGSADVHPHLASPAEDRERWDRDVANYPSNFQTLVSFFTDVKEGRLQGDKIAEKAAQFYGIQGPWYSVGWKMASLIEKTQGRAALVNAICEPRKLLAAYNRAVGLSGDKSLPLWPQSLIEALPPT
jgi:hypothetical protein